MLPVEPIRCPYCGESIEILVDDSIDRQQYVEDCSVCCRPIDIEVSVDPSGWVDVSCRRDDDA